LKISPLVFIRKEHTEGQRQRFKDHAASVRIDDSGNIEVLEKDIVNPNGDIKTNRLISVLPTIEEKIETFQTASNFFEELSHLNIILTNACNLSCTYCYEQHNKDYGRFTLESLRNAYEWLLFVNDESQKQFQFFGGEPLIHKKLILDFLSSDPDYFTQAWNNNTGQSVSICTNGLLLDNDFLAQYFSYPFTNMLLSLDTIKAEIDHRQIEQQDINRLLSYVRQIPAEVKQDKRLVIRCTLSQETAPYMNEFIDTIYSMGVRQMIVHPLILDSSKGFISWKNESWSQLHQDILNNLEKYFDLHIQFVEGVGKKHESNCMVGADMVAIDASGDFSGCYFFTNQKTNGTGHTILGNVFKNQVYTDRYREFQRLYNEMFDSEEQCRTCDYRNACYQCPAGNADTGNRLFRPDDMCQKIVKLYIDLQDDVAKKNFLREYQQTLADSEKYGFDKYTASCLMMLAGLYFAERNEPLEKYLLLDLPNYKNILYWFTRSLKSNVEYQSIDIIISEIDSSEASMVEFYKEFMKLQGLSVNELPTSGPTEDIFYLNTIGRMIVGEKVKRNSKLLKINKG
jgi:radical SAM protein with 4Fe4S-binding SPASM domain